MLGVDDARVYEIALARDFVVVTENHEDYLALARAALLHPGLILMAAEEIPGQIRALKAALGFIEREAATAGEAPRDWLVNRWVFATSDAMCAFGATHDDPPTP